MVMGVLNMTETLDMGKEIRRNQSILSTTGRGVIFFGLWDIIKINLYFILGRDTLLAPVEADLTVNRSFLLTVVYVTVMIAACIFFLLRFYIGRCATREAKDNIKKPYLGLVVFFIVFTVASMIVGITSVDTNGSLLDQLASMLVDITSIVTFIELLTASRRLRNYRSQLEGTGGTA